MPVRHARFAHLHVHSEFTFGESALSLESIVNTARRLKLPAIALTDHDNLYGAVQFSRLAWAAGVKPLIGCELTVADPGNADPFHLILLARDREGYGNLCRLITAANLGNQTVPCCPFEALSEHATGLVALTGCSRGLVGRHLARDDVPAARLALEELKRLFEDDLFLEVSHHGRPEDGPVVRAALDLAAELQLDPVATGNCRWADVVGQRALTALWSSQDRGKGLALMYQGDFSIMVPEVLAPHLARCPEALTNTLKVADRCRLILSDPEEERGRPPLPQPPGVDDAVAELRTRAWSGLESRLPPVAEPEAYFRRLQAELKTADRDAGRLLCLAETRRLADDLGIVVAPDRGEPSGSVLAFALGLSEVDPVLHDLESMRGPAGRVELSAGPDRRDGLLDELVRHWSGATRPQVARAARLLSYKRYALRGLVRDLAPALSAGSGAIEDALSALEGNAASGPAPGSPAAALVETCRVLEGLARKTTLHPSAMVLAPGPLVDHAPLGMSSNELPAAQIDDAAARDLGLPLFDLRGTRLLDVIGLTRDLVREGRGEDLDLGDLAVDPAGLRLIALGETRGVPTLEASGARDLARQLAPASLQEVATLIALHRQEPRREGIEQHYLARACGAEAVPSLHPRVDPLLADTLGFILYREQVEQIARELVYYEPAEARRLLATVESGDSGALEGERDHFLATARKRRVKQDLAREVFRRLASFARYGYGRAQAITAAALAVGVAAVKARYRPEFTAALIAVGSDSAAHVAQILTEAAAGGLEVLPPDVNTGGAEATVEQGRLRLGLAHVRLVGEATALDVVRERARKGPFESFDDLLSRAGPPLLSRRAAHNLVQAGACDGFGESRDVLLDRLARQTWKGARRQADLFAGLGTGSKAGESTAEPEPERQREALGLALVDLPRPARRGERSLAEIGFLDEGTEVSCAGEVMSLRTGVGRAADGRVAMLWDGTGLVEVDPRADARVRAWPGERLEVHGRVERAAAGRPPVVRNAECIQDPGGSAPAPASVLVVDVPGGAQDPTLLRRLRRLLGEHPGDMPVHLRVATEDHTSFTWALPDKSGITLGKLLKSRLEELVGEKSWQVLEKKEASAE